MCATYALAFTTFSCLCLDLNKYLGISISSYITLRLLTHCKPKNTDFHAVLLITGVTTHGFYFSPP